MGEAVASDWHHSRRPEYSLPLSAPSIAGDIPLAGDAVVLDVGVTAGRPAEQGAQRLVEQLVARGVPDPELDVDCLGDEAVADRRVGVGRQAAAVRAVEVDALDGGSEDRAAGVLNGTQRPAELVVARLLGRGDVLGGGEGGVGLGCEVGPAGDDQVELGAGIAGDRDVIGPIVRGDEVVEARRVVGRAGELKPRTLPLSSSSENCTLLPLRLWMAIVALSP